MKYFQFFFRRPVPQFTACFSAGGFILLFLFSFSLRAQTLYFCEGADSIGKPVNSNDSFFIAKNGGYITLLVSVNGKLFSDYAEFVIYNFDAATGKEIYDNTVRVDAAYNWTYFWKQIVFYNEGIYHVHVFNDEKKQLCEGSVTILKEE